MLPEIRKILYTTDLSENARYAFNYAAVLASKLDAKITILHVIDDISSSVSLIADYVGKERWQSLRAERAQEFREIVRKRLEAFCDEVSAELKSCPFIVEQSVIKEGNPAQEILAEIERGGYDMVVMGTHGHGIVTGALMGNTARRVVRRCEKPVTVVRLPE